MLNHTASNKKINVRSLVLVVAAIGCITYLILQALERNRENESLASAAANVLQAVLQGDGGTLYRYMPDDEKKPLGVQRDGIVRMANWAKQRMEGFTPRGAPVIEEQSRALLVIKQYLYDRSGRRAFIAVNVRTGAKGPVAPMIPYTLAMAGITPQVPLTEPRETSLVRGTKLLATWTAELPNLKKFCNKVRTGTYEAPTVTWDELVAGRGRGLQQLKDRTAQASNVGMSLRQ